MNRIPPHHLEGDQPSLFQNTARHARRGVGSPGARRPLSLLLLAAVACAWTVASQPVSAAITSDGTATQAHEPVQFDLRSVRDGAWSDVKTWSQPRVPKAGDRVLVSRATRV